MSCNEKKLDKQKFIWVLTWELKNKHRKVPIYFNATKNNKCSCFLIPIINRVKFKIYPKNYCKRLINLAEVIDGSYLSLYPYETLRMFNDLRKLFPSPSFSLPFIQVLLFLFYFLLLSSMINKWKYLCTACMWCIISCKPSKNAHAQRKCKSWSNKIRAF